MNPGLVRIVALLVTSLLWLSTGLQPVLARAQTDAWGEADPAETDRAEKEHSTPCPAPSDADHDEQEEGTCTGAGLGDMMDRQERAYKPSHLGAALAVLPIQTPASRPERPHRLVRWARRHVVPHDWGQQAHWPCGPPVGPITSAPRTV